MSDPILPTPRSQSIPPITVVMSGERHVAFVPLPTGGGKIVLSAPAKDGTRRPHGQIDFGAERITEAMMALAELCRRYNVGGPGNA